MRKINIAGSWATSMGRLAYFVPSAQRIGTTKAGCLALGWLLWFGAVSIRADTHYVSLDGTNDSANGYNTWPGAATQIQRAVDAADAATADTVIVSNGTYNLTNQISIAKNITVRSFTEQGHGTNDTSINGNYPTYTTRCVFMTAGTLDGFTVSNGYANAGGGGIYFDHGSGFVKNCNIYKNTTGNGVYYGGGVFLAAGGTVSNCTVVGNTCSADNHANVTHGGGAYLESGGLLIDSHISGNSAYWGGGVSHRQGWAGSIVRCTISGNTAYYGGGGAYLLNVYGVGMSDCVISNNSAAYVGGVYANGGGDHGYKVVNSIIIGNSATEGPGGAYLEANGILSNCQVIANTATIPPGGADLAANDVVANCIIANNTCNYTTYGPAGIRIRGGLVKNCLIYGNTNLSAAGQRGGGVYLDNAAANTNYPYGLINCTIANNKGNDYGGDISANNTNNYVENCIVFSNVNFAGAQNNIYNYNAANTNNYWHTCVPDTLAPNQGNITGNPLFADLAHGNCRLSPRSPCINKGVNQDWMTNAVDLDGKTRIRYITVDMGCYEYMFSGTMFRGF